MCECADTFGMAAPYLIRTLANSQIFTSAIRTLLNSQFNR